MIDERDTWLRTASTGRISGAPARKSKRVRPGRQRAGRTSQQPSPNPGRRDRGMTDGRRKGGVAGPMPRAKGVPSVHWRVVASAGSPIHHTADRPGPRLLFDKRPNVVAYLDVTTPYDEADKARSSKGSAESSKPRGRLTALDPHDEDKSTESDRLVDLCIPYCESKGFLDDLLSPCTEGVVINERNNRLTRFSRADRNNLGPERASALRDHPNDFDGGCGGICRGKREQGLHILRHDREFRLPLRERTSPANQTTRSSPAREGPADPEPAGATVKVFGVGRGGSAERAPLPQERLTKLQDFWTRFFTAAGASSP